MHADTQDTRPSDATHTAVLASATTRQVEPNM